MIELASSWLCERKPALYMLSRTWMPPRTATTDLTLGVVDRPAEALCETRPITSV